MWALSYPYVGPILPLCRPIVSTNLLELGQNSFDLSFFPFRGTPWTPKPRKTRRFLTTPRWNSDTPKATKHRKTRCFLTPRTKNTVIYRGSRGSEVSPRWRWGEPPRGRRQGRLASITFGYQPKASGQDTGSPWQWPAPGFKGYRPCRRPLFMSKFSAFVLGRENHQVPCKTFAQSCGTIRRHIRNSNLMKIERYETASRKLAKRCLRNPLKTRKCRSRSAT